MSINLRPLKGQYVVSRAKETENKIGSFYIPDQAQEKPFEGIVEAIPKWTESFNKTVQNYLIDNKDNLDAVPFPENPDAQVKLGERVLFGKYSGIEIKFAGETYIVLKEEDILAVVVPVE